MIFGRRSESEPSTSLSINGLTPSFCFLRQTLVALYLEWNTIGAERARYLVDDLRTNQVSWWMLESLTGFIFYVPWTLKTINLRSNQIDIEGIKYLIQAKRMMEVRSSLVDGINANRCWISCLDLLNQNMNVWAVIYPQLTKTNDASSIDCKIRAQG